MVDTTDRSVRVRIAPSPTGDPHVGTGYIALFNYAFARKMGGKFILRIEDTDQARYRADSEAAITDALNWLGVTWDEGPDVGGDFGPYHQSKRTAIYQEHCEKLLASGHAYRCFCSPETLAEIREECKAAKINPPMYDRRCKAMDPAEAKKRADAGEECVVRMVIPRDGTIKFEDKLRGEVEISASQIDDQVLLKGDGFPTYHLANVVDDHLMGISHVVRAEEWISSTPKHVLLYRYFGWDAPEWVHMPLLRNNDKSKISKRKNPVSIHYYRDIGILPDALRNFLSIMGYSFGGDREVFGLDEMIEGFSWDRVSLGGPVFDQDKLRWMNEQHIRALTNEELVDAFMGWRYNREHMLKIAPLIHKRIKTLSDFAGATEYMFSSEVDYAPFADKLSIPDVAKKDIWKGILELVDDVDKLDGFEPEALEATARAFCEKKGWKPKHVFGLLRIGSTGRKASPPLFETMAVIGKDICRRRLRELAEFIKKMK
ncbi:MAG: glutamate--tRNA ligase [Myxococcales bacterium]|nr:glutamate--tRNA ligase [Myxococcales bacterium]